MDSVRTLEGLRVASSKTILDVALALGITKQAYWRKERGLRKLTLKEAFKLAELFQVPVETVFLCAQKVTESVRSEQGLVG